MDIHCALLTPCTTTNYKPVGEQKDNGHPHPLILCNIPVIHYGLRKCGGCRQQLEESAYYYCVSCKLFLNKSCAELPRVIQHPFHPYHPLTLSDSHHHFQDPLTFSDSLNQLPRMFCCKACLDEVESSFYYRCELCEFYLHPKCASPILYPMIYMSKLHPHPLAYSDNVPNYNKCSKCSKIFIHAGFRCLQCKFDVHDHCLPLLPPTVKTKWHRHPLTLIHGPIKNEGEEFNFYCDCCEEKRDLKDPTYYCAKCNLISHVRCVLWEVMDYLQRKSSKVGELCNTKVIIIGEAKAIDNIYAAAGKNDRVEQGDHQDIMDKDSDHILIGLCNEIAATSAELMKDEAKLEEYQLEESLSERLSERRLYQRYAYKIEFS